MKNYLSLIKFSHTVFALPFAIIGYALAIATPGFTFIWTDLILVLLCMVFARSAAMAFNRYADSDIDSLNERTAKREIPSGIVTRRNALVFIAVNCLGFIIAAGLLNRLCLYLSPVALLIILGYSYTKRFTWLCHLILGLGLSLAPLGAYIAVTEQFALLPAVFSLVVLTWVGGFDIIYSLQDDQFDREHDLYSMPARLGRKNAILISILLHLVTAAAVCYAGYYGSFGMLFWLGAGLFTGFLIYQHLIITAHDLRRVNLAFFTANGIASVVFGIFVICDLFLS
jgi:4-hydroxybenzoate polyprenyltransferase